MTLIISYSPYTYGDPLTEIKFHTNISLQHFVSNSISFPDIPTTESTMNNLSPILNRIILFPEARPFLRPVNSPHDKARYYTNLIDLSEIFKKVDSNKYTEFSQFVDDLQLLIKKVAICIPKNPLIHRQALELSAKINTLLVELKNSPRSSITQSSEQEKQLHDRAFKQICEAINSSQSSRRKRKDEQEAEAKERSKSGRLVMEQTPDERTIKDLHRKIKNMSDSALITVIEIIEKKSFRESLLPYTVDLNKCDNETIHILSKFVLDNSISQKNDRVAYVGRPSIPDNLQEIQTKYKEELSNWLKPPSSKSNQ